MDGRSDTTTGWLVSCERNVDSLELADTASENDLVSETVTSPGFVARRGKDGNFVMGHSR